MASISVRKDTKKLFFNFTYLNMRFREQTNESDTKANRKKLEKTLILIEAEIVAGTFNFETYFPHSSSLKRVKDAEIKNQTQLSVHHIKTPLFSDFVENWLEEGRLTWRQSHYINVVSIVNKHYLPSFSQVAIGEISRENLKTFRAKIAKLPGRNGNKTLSANRINKIMAPLKMIFDEAVESYGITTPFYKIKPLKTPKIDIHPFRIEEVNKIISHVRPDYKNYYLVRFFTALRTGEVDGLKWKYVDFENRVIRVRETIVLGNEDYTKNDTSQRDIKMSDMVYNALLSQFKTTNNLSKFVFCTNNGIHLDHNNVTKRVWYPLLARLRLEKRRPYQTRHTTATLWLASGESPEWIANQMGHASTEMLFKTYSRFVPNLTRNDGSAFERLINEKLGHECGEQQ